jgi:hypothetical protein
MELRLPESNSATTLVVAGPTHQAPADRGDVGKGESQVRATPAGGAAGIAPRRDYIWEAVSQA